MKKICLLFLICSTAYAQPPGEWMWIHGSDTSSAPPNWGVQGVPSPTNVPGAVYEPCEWRDLNGNFWLFGGLPSGWPYAALWKYDPLTNQWTWMKGPNTNTSAFAGDFGVQGVPSPNNLPPSYYFCSATWVDLQGNLWLFGGILSGGTSSALWRYEIPTNTWTWMKGPSTLEDFGTYGTQTVPNINNNPPARNESASAWTDNEGGLWLFGGLRNSGWFNDLWRYDIATNTWTWMKGDSVMGQPGVYGTLNVENPANKPGARASYTHWKDNSNNLWLFGGYYTNNTNFNDLWKYHITSNSWTWMGGSSTPNTPANHGTMCIPSSTTIPSGRSEDRSVFTDQNGNFWLFGGYDNGNSASKFWGDLWVYCTATNQWAWISGSDTANPAGNLGTIGVPSPTNRPDGRMGAVGWYDGSSHFYMFGGWSTSVFRHNDLWKYTIDPNCYPCSILTPVTGIHNVGDFTIQPNPASDEFTILFPSTLKEDVEIKIYNIMGKELLKTFSRKSDSRTIVSTAGLNNGIYILQISCENKIFNERVIVTHQK